MEVCSLDEVVEEVMLLQGALMQISTSDQRYQMKDTDFVREYVALSEKYGDKRPTPGIKLHYITEKEVQYGR